jgi:hypothetical protein
MLLNESITGIVPFVNGIAPCFYEKGKNSLICSRHRSISCLTGSSLQTKQPIKILSAVIGQGSISFVGGACHALPGCLSSRVCYPFLFYWCRF